MTLWGLFFCCCLFHFHKETLIHSEVHPQFLLVRPEPAFSLLHQCGSFLAPLPGDANWVPLTLWEEGHLARGYSLFTHRVMHLAHPWGSQLGTAGALAQAWSSPWASGKRTSICRQTRHIHVQVCTAGSPGCALCAQLWVAVAPKEQRNSVFVTAWDTRDKKLS